MAMRVEQGAPFVDPTRENGRTDETRKKADRASSRRDGRDTVQISKEARDLQTGRSAPRAETDAVGDAGPDGRMERILQRLESGFYDGRESCLALADELLGVFGI